MGETLYFNEERTVFLAFCPTLPELVQAFMGPVPIGVADQDSRGRGECQERRFWKRPKLKADC
jgi:hypothetical protein